MIERDNEVIGFTDSARLLSWIFPKEKKSWHMHLAEIVLGMNSHRYRISHDPCFDDIYFQTEDLQNFAILYSEGSLSESEIESRIYDFFKKIESEPVKPTLTRKELHSYYSDGDGFLGVKPEGDPSYFRLSKSEAHKLYQDIEDLSNRHEKLVKAMLTIGVLFRALKTDYTPTAAEFDAIQDQISTYVEETEELSGATEEILDELVERIEELDAT